jgi:hypothetical protein
VMTNSNLGSSVGHVVADRVAVVSGVGDPIGRQPARKKGNIARDIAKRLIIISTLPIQRPWVSVIV